jgi:dipeptidyl aminopeptidase/acylaminoacyl peptidase
MNNQPFSPPKLRLDKLHRGVSAFSHPAAFLVLCLAAALPAVAQNGTLLSRTELVISDEVLKSRQVPTRLFNAVQRARFWKFTYESDGLKVCGYMAAPRQSGPLPCVIENRGGNRDFGAWTDTNSVRWMAPLAAAGYFVIASNYRGSPGSEGREEFGGADVNDVLNLLPLIDSLKEEIDPARIGMEGWSRGGMMTYLALTRTKRIAAAVIGSGEVDLAEGIKLRPEMETNVIGELVPGYATNKARALRARSAVHWPEKLAKDTPILLLAGTADWRVNPMNSLRMAEKLYQQRHPFRIVMFEGGDHGLSEHRDERDRITLNWFNTYVRDRRPWPSLEPHGR